MAQEITKTFTVVTGGGTDTITITDYINSYIVTSATISLSSSYTINYSGSPTLGTILRFNYAADIDLNGNTVTILGRQLSQEEANSNLFIIANWNGSTFDVAILKDNGNSNYATTATYTVPNGGGTKTLVPGIDPTVLILDGTPTLSSPFTVTGTGVNNGDEFYVFYNTQVVAPVGVNYVTIFGIRLNDTITVGGSAYIHAVYDGSAWQARVVRTIETLIGIDEINTEAVTDTIVVDCSFETGEQGNNRIYMYTNFTVLSFSYSVIKALSGTDAGTITPGINGTPIVLSPPGAISIAASTAINTTGTVTVASLNTGTAGSYIDLVSAKTTVGGKLRVSLKILKTKS
jgi:hypothetical protein